jgi:hypothetical protein
MFFISFTPSQALKNKNKKINKKDFKKGKNKESS